VRVRAAPFDVAQRGGEAVPGERGDRAGVTHRVDVSEHRKLAPVQAKLAKATSLGGGRVRGAHRHAGEHLGTRD
jgi:hypothetical protein